MFSETSTVEYTVCLKENDYYKETCMTEGKEYLQALTDEIRIIFNYNRTYSKDTNADFNYYIKSKLSILNRDNEREIFTEEKKITKEKNYKDKKTINNIQDMVEVKLDEYKQLVDRYIMDYSVNSKANLEIQLVINEDDQEKTVGSIIIPLLERTYSITKNTISNLPDESMSSEFKNYLFVALLLKLYLIS